MGFGRQACVLVPRSMMGCSTVLLASSHLARTEGDLQALVVVPGPQRASYAAQSQSDHRLPHPSYSTARSRTSSSSSPSSSPAAQSHTCPHTAPELQQDLDSASSVAYPASYASPSHCSNHSPRPQPPASAQAYQCYSALAEGTAPSSSSFSFQLPVAPRLPQPWAPDPCAASSIPPTQPRHHQTQSARQRQQCSCVGSAKAPARVYMGDRRL